MALQKQPVNLNFGSGIDTKTDPFQLPLGKLLVLENSVFTKGGIVQKRHGFRKLKDLAESASSITTFDNSLVAIGSTLQAFSNDYDEWVSQGAFAPVDLSVMPVMRSATGQTACDSALNNGLICVAFVDAVNGAQYQVVDAETGQIIVPATSLPATASHPRVFSLGRYFIVTFMATVAATPHLQYVSIPVNDLTNPASATDISTQLKTITSGYDGFVANDNLYLAWYGSDATATIRIRYLTSTLSLSSQKTQTDAAYIGDLISVTADTTTATPTVYITWYNATGDDAYTAVYSSSLDLITAPVQSITNEDVATITSVAQNGSVSIYYSVTTVYGYNPQTYVNGAYSTASNVRTDILKRVTMTSAGTLGTASAIHRASSLFSKAFLVSGVEYVTVAYQSTYQNTYFVIDEDGNHICKFAYSNGGGYPINQVLGNVDVTDSVALIPYLIKDFVTTISTGTNQAPVGGIYTQTGVNVAFLEFGVSTTKSAEIAQALHLSGGYIWQYDGVKPVEHNFHLYPDNLGRTTSTTGGSMTAQQYFYQVTYEWTDAQGILHRSAPSIPLSVDISGSGTSTNTVTLKIPTLRYTAKTGNSKVRIVIYRWSTAQQAYYQVTSFTSPTLNNPAVDSIDYTDTVADSSIVGNALIYTTGGVIENVAPGAVKTMTIFDNRLWALSAEGDQFYFSKEVVQGTPVEMSDLFTYYIADTISSQGPTGPTRAAAAMDDKLIVFKKNAIYYVNGVGPTATGSSDQYSQPIFVSSTVGCENQRSIVLIPQGLMFQSDKGIWLLGRDLSTSYIGADVAAYNSSTVLSAIAIPGTNQVRFTLDSGVVLIYDYYYQQWGTFNGIPNISSCIYQGLHTYINDLGQLYQQSTDYLDGSRPVLMRFKTGWINLTGLQGFQRAYFFYMLGKYYSPHKLQVKVAYDYADNPETSIMIDPVNYTPAWGGDTIYGGGPAWGGVSNIERWRVFFQRQKCESLQIEIAEVYDASLGVQAGAGLTISGLNIVIGAKAGYPKLVPSLSAG